MSHGAKKLLLFLVDSIFLVIALMLTIIAYKGGRYDETFFLRHLEAFTLIFPVWFLTYYIEGLYSLQTFNKDGLIVSIGRAQIANTVVAFIFFYLFNFKGLSPRANILLIALLGGLGIYLNRKVFYAVFSKKGFVVPAVTFGNQELVSEIEEHLEERPYLGFRIIKKIEGNQELNIPESTKLIVIDRSYFNNRELLGKLLDKRAQGIQLLEMSAFSELITGKIPVGMIDEAWFIEYCTNLNERSYVLLKSLMDKMIALGIFLFIMPIYIILLPILLLVSGRPLFYSQIRTGLNNKAFRIYKLRTMTTDAEKGGAKWATPGDSRVTPIGKFLRMSRLDELPQLWNILNGDMSLVGPRPERPEIIKEKLEPTIPFYNTRHLVKPGVTGWAQVNFRYGYSEEDSMRKLQYDLYYVKNKSIWLDLRIILKTIKTVITGMGH